MVLKFIVYGGGNHNHPSIENTCKLKLVFKNHHTMKKFFLVWSWNLLCMLEMSFPSFISQKPGEIAIFGTFLAKYFDFDLFYYVHCKSAILRFSLYDVIVMSYSGCLYLFWYYEKTHQLDMGGFSFQVHKK